ncbi:MAG: inorganic phosphate transporter [Candidatus Bathyarchaeota archaeon]
MLELLIIVVIGTAIALTFNFFNGMNDAANSIASVVSTRVLSPRTAVMWAAGFHFVAAFVFTHAVAKTVGKGLVFPEALTPLVIVAGLAGAIIWIGIATRAGLPISASHALIGGLVGAALDAAGFGVIAWGGFTRIAIFMVLAPLIGMAVGFLLMILTSAVVARTTASPSKANGLFKRLQLVSAAAYSLAHGSNDAQNAMGVITILLLTAGFVSTFIVPLWAVLASYGAISLGTILGGWKVIRTMGMKITKLTPVHGFCAETSGSLMIIGASLAGIPVSTTHVISGSIIGVGATKRLSAVRWGVARNMIWAWIITIPVSAAVGGALNFLIRIFI